MKAFRFHFNTDYAKELRDAVNARQKQSIDYIHTEKQTNGEYRAWARTCAAMDRLEDTLDYLNRLELGKGNNPRTAFDFYDFMNNAYIVIECIKTLGKIFRIDSKFIEEIENSKSVFKNKLCDNATDQKYFEYIRSLCSVHPLCTNHQKDFLFGSKFHCCPFVIWKSNSTFHICENADLVAIIYPSDHLKETIYHGLYLSQFEQYINNWISTDRESFRKIGLTFEEKAFYDILMVLRDEYNFEYGTDKVVDGVVVNDKCRTLAKKIKEIIDTKSSFADWLNNQIVRDQLKFDIKVCLIKNGYPPQYSPEVFRKVMEQVENFEENN